MRISNRTNTIIFLLALIFYGIGTDALNSCGHEKDACGRVVARNLRGKQVLGLNRDGTTVKELNEWPHPVEIYKRDNRPKVLRQGKI